MADPLIARLADVTDPVSGLSLAESGRLEGVSERDGLATVVLKVPQGEEDTGALKDLSFDTISATGAHGASSYYKADKTSNARIEPGQLYLIDSGGQYVDGTTDVTRVVPIGAPTAKAAYMAVPPERTRTTFGSSSPGMNSDTSMMKAPAYLPSVRCEV